MYHHNAVKEQHFLEYFIQSDGSFSHMLHYYRLKEYLEMKKFVKFAEHILVEKLQELGIDLNELLDFVFSNVHDNSP